MKIENNNETQYAFNRVLDRYNTSYLLNFDGGCEPNPGKMVIGGILRGKNKVILHKYSVALKEEGTNNIAEYVSLLYGLRAALELGVSTLHVRGDSMLVINACIGKWKCKHENLTPIFSNIKDEIAKFDNITFEWIPRYKNHLADRYTHETEDTITLSYVDDILDEYSIF